MSVRTYTDGELAALIVLLFRITPDQDGSFGDFKGQVGAFYDAVRAQIPDSDNSDFKSSILAMQAFYIKNPTLVDATHAAIAKLLTTLQNTDLGAVRWGECGFASLSQVNDIAELELVVPPPAAGSHRRTE